MASTNPFIEIPFGIGGMIARTNRLRSEPTELLDAQGVTLEDALLEKEAGSIKLDAAGITGAPNIIALKDWNPDTSTAGGGTISTTIGSQTVTGVGTAFLTTTNVGDRIQISGESSRVIAVASNTSLTTASPWKTTNAGVAYTIIRQQRLASATDNGNIYLEINGNLDNSNPVTGLTSSLTPGRFVSGGKESAALPRKLFYFSGRDAVRVLNGTTFAGAVIASPPGDWASFNQPVNGVIHENRLIGWGNQNDPHRIYVSSPDNQEDFLTIPFSFRISTDVGDRVWCGVRFNGVLFFWKHPRGIAYLCDNAPSPEDWCIRIKSVAIGCAPSPYAALALDDDVLFMAAEGSFHLLSAVTEMGGTRSSDLSYALGLSAWLRDNVNLSRLDLVQSTWYQHKKLAIFSVPATGSLSNNLILKFDFGGIANGENVKFSYSRRDAAGAVEQRRDTSYVERPITGEASFVYLQEQSARTKDSAGYTATFQTPHLDVSHADASFRGKRKRFEALEFVTEPVSAGTLTVQVYVDQVLKQTLSLSATGRRTNRANLSVGDGYTISLKVTNTTINEDFKILSALVWLAPGPEDHSRPS